MPIPFEDSHPKHNSIKHMLHNFLPHLNFGGGGGGGLPPNFDPFTAGLGINPQPGFAQNHPGGVFGGNGGGGGNGDISGALRDLLFGPGSNAPHHIAGTNFVPNRVEAGSPDGQHINPIQQALAQLDNLVNQSMSMPSAPSEADLQAALQDAAAGIRKQYEAQIGAYAAQNAGAKHDTHEGAHAIRGMFGGLARTYNRAGQREFKQGSHLANQLRDMGQQQQQFVTNQAEQINDAGMQGAAALGLQDLAKQIHHTGAEAAQNLGGAASKEGFNAAMATKKMAGNNRTFMNTSGQASRLEGTNRAADLYSQLQDFLQANRAQMASLAGERASAIAQAKAGIQSDFASAQSDYAQMQQDAQQQLIDNKMAMLQMALDIQNNRRDDRLDKLKFMADQQQNQQGGGFGDILPDVMSGPSSILNKSPGEVKSAYADLANSVPMRYGYTGQKKQDTDVPLKDNYGQMLWFIRQYEAKSGHKLSEAEERMLAAALLQQLG